MGCLSSKEEEKKAEKGLMQQPGESAKQLWSNQHLDPNDFKFSQRKNETLIKKPGSDI
jgi:hypothetical protein